MHCECRTRNGAKFASSLRNAENYSRRTKKKAKNKRGDMYYEQIKVSLSETVKYYSFDIQSNMAVMAV